jgi:hypothetical protein
MAQSFYTSGVLKEGNRGKAKIIKKSGSNHNIKNDSLGVVN